MSVQFSGHTDISQEEYEKYYLTHLRESVAVDDDIFVGGAEGADKWTQLYAIEMMDGCDDSYKSIIVCDIKDQDNRLDKRFLSKNGFDGYTKRDQFMTKNTMRDVAYIRYKPMSLGSGTLMNVLRRHFGIKVSEDFKLHARDLFSKSEDKDSLGLFDYIIDSFMQTTHHKYESLPKIIRDCTMGYKKY